MHAILILIILCFTLTCGYAQVITSTPLPVHPGFDVPYGTLDTNLVGPIANRLPVFPGGEEAFKKYMNSCPYPPIAVEKDIEGSVTIMFVVERDGSVSHVKVTRGVDKVLHQAVLEHARKMPRWKPAELNGQTLPVGYQVEVKFDLANLRKNSFLKE